VLWDSLAGAVGYFDFRPRLGCPCRRRPLLQTKRVSLCPNRRLALACVVPSDFRSPASSRIFSSAIARGVVRIRDRHMRQIYFHRRRSSPGFRGMTASKTTGFPRPDMKRAFALNAGLLFPVSNLTVLCWLCPPEALIGRSTSGQTRISVLQAERSGMSVWKIFQKQTDFPTDQVDGLFLPSRLRIACADFEKSTDRYR
jgi:hypothetical protein